MHKETHELNSTFHSHITSQAGDSIQDMTGRREREQGEEGRGQSIRMKGISPDIDFSYDFQDLDLRRISK